MTISISPAEFMQTAPTAAVSGNTPAAARYAAEFRRIARDYANRRPRSLQKALGPSELGVSCDRQVVGKLIGHPVTNNVVDPWASLVGTWCHSGADHMLQEYNTRHGVARFVTETRVVPHEEHPGHADVYDGFEQVVGDHKFLGDTSMAQVRSPQGPPRKYKAQLHLYGKGFQLLGLPVKAVRLIAWPRTGSSLDALYVWESPQDRSADELIDEVFVDTHRRKMIADLVQRGHLRFDQVPVVPSDDECYFCPFFRPESARDGGPGCPGNRAR